MTVSEVNLQKPTHATLDLYRVRRKASMDMVHGILKTIPREVMLQAARQLGLYHKKSIAVETEQALDVLFNHTIFHHLHNEKKLVDRYAGEALLSKTISREKSEMLGILQKASWGVLAVIETFPSGVIHVEDCLNDRTFLLMDEGLSSSTMQGFMIATSYLTFPEFAMTTGTALPLIYHIDNLEELIDEFDLENSPFYELPIKQQTKFITRITRQCLEHGALDHIGFVEQSTVFQ